MLKRLFGPRNIDEQIEEKRAALSRKNQALAGTTRSEEQPGRTRQGFISPGMFLKGDRFPDDIGVSRDQNSVLWLKEHLLDQHMLVIGATGMGKTVALTRIIEEVLKATDRDIYIVDGKGEEEFALEIANQIYAARGEPAPWFRLGTKSGLGACYDGFQGDKYALFNRLMALCSIGETKGDAQYYDEGMREILQLVCLIHVPFGEPPRSFEEVRTRMSKKWLKAAYKAYPHELEAIGTLDPRIQNGLAMRIRGLERELGPFVNPHGFQLGTGRAAIFSIRTQSVGITGRRFLSCLIEDVKDFVGNRQERPGLLIIDEFGMFGSENINDLLALARSAHMGVILATQDVATLGDDLQKSVTLANTVTKILMGTSQPTDIVELAGTIEKIEASISHNESGATGTGSAHIKATFRVDPQEVRQLQPGEAFLIRQGRAVKLRITKPPRPALKKEAVVLTGWGEQTAHTPYEEETPKEDGVMDLEI